MPFIPPLKGRVFGTEDKQAKDANGLQGCKDYFKKNIHLINKHSDKLDTSIIKVDGKWKIVKLDNPKW